MTLKLLSIFILTFLISCTDTERVDNDLFIVAPDTAYIKPKQADPTEPPPPPLVKPYYTNFNFLVDSLGNLFYFQTQTYRWKCGTGLDENTPPEFIDLRPFEIAAIPDEGLKEFIEINILNHEPSERVVAIGLLRDTVKSASLLKLTQVLRDTSNHTRWFIRKATDEEAIVLDYKKRQARYHPDDILWDSTMTMFPPKVEITDFTPPKIVEE